MILFVDSPNQDTDLLQTIIDQLNLLDREDEAGGVETVGEESSLASSAASPASDILPATALDKPKEKVCGVKGESKCWKTTSLTALPMFRRPACAGCIRRSSQRLHPAPADWCVDIFISYNIYNNNIYNICICRLLGVRQGWCPGGRAGAAAETGGEDQRRRRHQVRNVVREKIFAIIHENMYSTVLYCWVAAITTKAGEFVCTGTLVAEDLVVTSGSCINL